MIYKKIAFTDLEFTGLDPCKNEIIECGVIIADAKTLEEITRYESKIKPEHIENADPESLAIAGYKAELWQDALPLNDVLKKYSELATGALFASWTFLDWIFLVEAYRKHGLPTPVGYHALDIFSIAYEKLHPDPAIEKLKLSYLLEHFGIEKEPRPHRAINGAEKAYLLYKKLREL